MLYGNVRPKCTAHIGESGLLTGTFRLTASNAAKDPDTIDNYGTSIWQIEYKPEEEQSKLKMDTSKIE